MTCLRVCFLCAVAVFFCFVSVTECQLDFEVQQTFQGIQILCSVADLRSTSLSFIDSLLIFRSVAGTRQILVSLTSHYGPNDPVSHSTDAQVTGHLDNEGTLGGFLRIAWDHSQADIDGEYICDLNGVDKDYVPLTLTKQLLVQVKPTCPCFESTPAVLRVGFTQELEVVCYIPNNAAINISQLASLEIIIIRDGVKQILAEINSLTGRASMEGNGVVNGSLGDTNTFLHVVWEYPPAEMASDYICEGAGIGVSGDLVFFSKHVNVSLEVPDSEELIQRLFEMYEVQKELNCCHDEIDRLTQTSSGTNSQKSTTSLTRNTSPSTSSQTATQFLTRYTSSPNTSSRTTRPSPTKHTSSPNTSPRTTKTSPTTQTSSPITSLRTTITSPTTHTSSPTTSSQTTTTSPTTHTSLPTTSSQTSTTSPTTHTSSPTTSSQTTTTSPTTHTSSPTTSSQTTTTSPTTQTSSPSTSSQTTTTSPTTHTSSPTTSSQTTTTSPTTTAIVLPRSCEDANLPRGKNTVIIQPDDGLGSFAVLCEVVTPQEVWTVFQKRFDGSVSFYRSFNEYKSGFGNVNGEFWLGLDNIRRLLLQNKDNNRLKIDLRERTSEMGYNITYPTFSIGPGGDYVLSISGIHGEDYGLYSCVGEKFSTFDHGYVTVAGSYNRAAGWWFPTSGGYVNINGVWASSSASSSMYWYGIRMSWYYPMDRTEMKFRRN